MSFRRLSIHEKSNQSLVGLYCPFCPLGNTGGGSVSIFFRSDPRIGWFCLWETPVLPAAWKTFLVYLLFAVVLVVLLILGRSRSRIYLAGLCALATIIHHLVLCIRTGKVYPVSLAIAIGLALALLFLLIKSKRPGLWLSDAYTLSLAIWLIYDGPIYALSRIPGLNVGRLSPFIPVPADPLSKKSG